MGEVSPQPPYTVPIFKVITFLQQSNIATLEIFNSNQEYADHVAEQASDTDSVASNTQQNWTSVTVGEVKQGQV